jgi:3-oxoacyl-[acyl-carrier protein] reductase
MSETLSGKIAIVIGGSRSIGAAIALELADQGADVAITCVTNAYKANAVVEAIQAKGERGPRSSPPRWTKRQ